LLLFQIHKTLWYEVFQGGSFDLDQSGAGDDDYS